MNLSLNWLKDFVKIPSGLDPEELGVLLTNHTVEIDGVFKQSDRFANMVVAEILEVNPHPNADRLQIAIVNDGKNKRKIVCGATNIAKGQKVPLALPGAVLPDGTEIRETKVRGEDSEGMLCAEDELGLGDDHSGIMILDSGAKVGRELADQLGFKDVVFEVDNKSITNRPDLWGHFGMAREISAFLNAPKTKLFKALETAIIENKAEKSEELEVRIEDYDLCPRYMALAVDNVKIEPSPRWLKDRLIAAGVRPLNNIVDITNYVMLESGQPLHAFDFSLVSKEKESAKIIVRRARKNETIVTLDGVERKTTNETLLIAGREEALAIAGIMGGADSEIKEDTKKIILESANFNHVSIRKTSTRLGLRTEASMRFEKSLDPALCEQALFRAAELIREICPQAQIAETAIDVKKYENKQEPIIVKIDWLEKFIGLEIGKEKALDILSRLGFAVSASASGELEVVPPSWRAGRDVGIKEDIAEEIARIYGYENIPPLMPRVEIIPPVLNENRGLERKIKEVLSRTSALSEVLNYSFVGKEQLEKLSVNHELHIALLNSVSLNHSLLRQSLIPNLLLNLKTNQVRYERVGIFEIGNVFMGFEGDYETGGKDASRLPYQTKKIGILIAKKNCPEYEFAGGAAMYGLKSVIGELFGSFRLEPAYAASEISPNWANKDIFALIMLKGQTVGYVAGIDKAIAKKIGLKKDAAVAEIELEALKKLYFTGENFKFSEFEKFPPLTRDLAFVVNEKVLYEDIKKEISDFHEYIKEVRLFDIYQGEKIGAHNKNLAFNVVYRAEKTLTGVEVDEIQKNLVKRLEERFEARIRDF